MTEPILYAEHAADVLGRAAHLIADDARFALIASVAIKGGTARELGSLAIVEADGRMTGYMSNGCIDRDIQLQGRTALESGEARTLRYGEGSPFVDLVLPCGGALTLAVDPAPDHEALLAAHRALLAREPARLSFAPADAEAVTIEYAPRPVLALAGRGAIFRATAEVAQSAGFELRLMSPEEEDLDAVGHLASGRLHRLTAPDAVPAFDLDRWSALMTLFHDHDWEPAIIAAALATPARYVGALGSSRTHELRRMALAGLGVGEDDIDRVRGPLGLVPSLRSARLIAVSAVAELAAVFPQSQRRVG